MRERFNRLLRLAAGLSAAGLLYAAFYAVTGWGIPCIIHLVTGFYCTGCGITRMSLALLNLDFALAFRSNPGLMLCLPPIGVLLLWQAVDYIKKGTVKPTRGQNILLWAIIIFLLLFTILRNLPPFWFLRPL